MRSARSGGDEGDHGDSETSCLLCGERFATADELTRHHEEVHENDDEWGILDWILAVPALLWSGRWYLFWLVVAVFVALGALGITGKDAAPERRNCLGYNFVREIAATDAVDEFESVKPEAGWDCEYSLNNEGVLIRFKKQRDSAELEFEGRDREAFGATEKVAAAKGYTEAP